MISILKLRILQFLCQSDSVTEVDFARLMISVLSISVFGCFLQIYASVCKCMQCYANVGKWYDADLCNYVQIYVNGDVDKFM